MAVLDPTAIALLVKLCAPPGISARLIDAIARVETGGDPSLPPNGNKDGTYDYGLMRINSINLGWTGLTPQTASDKCKSVAAASKVLIRDAGGIGPLKDEVVARLAEAIRRYNGAAGDIYLRKVGSKLAQRDFPEAAIGSATTRLGSGASATTTTETPQRKSPCDGIPSYDLEARTACHNEVVTEDGDQP